MAFQQAQIARRTLDQALYSTNEIIGLLAERFRHTGLPTPVVSEILSEVLALHDELAEHTVDDTQFLFSRAIALNVIGTALLEHGEIESAGTALEDCLDIMRTLSMRDPENVTWQEYLWAALIDLGDFRLRGGDVENALRDYEEALAVMQALAVLEPEEMTWQPALASTFEGIGRVRRAAGDMDAALQAYREALAIRREVAAREPDNLGRQRGVSAVLTHIGAIGLESGDYEAALEAYE